MVSFNHVLLEAWFDMKSCIWLLDKMELIESLGVFLFFYCRFHNMTKIVKEYKGILDSQKTRGSGENPLWDIRNLW